MGLMSFDNALQIANFRYFSPPIELHCHPPAAHLPPTPEKCRLSNLSTRGCQTNQHQTAAAIIMRSIDRLLAFCPCTGLQPGKA